MIRPSDEPMTPEHSNKVSLQVTREFWGWCKKRGIKFDKYLGTIEYVKDILNGWEFYKLHSRNNITTQKKPPGIEIENKLGVSAEAKHLLSLMQRYTRSKSSILIQGEQGLDKKGIAELIHYGDSNRKLWPFVAIDCKGYPRDEIAADLFGASSRQSRRKTNKVEQAGEGTIFISNIDCMEMEIQSRLLGALQRGLFDRDIDFKTVEFKARLICSTSDDLLKLVKTGEFRQELYYSISILSLNVPPLRERQQDIAFLIAQHIKRQVKAGSRQIESISQDAIQLLLNYSWPGNNRELENVIEGAVIASNSRELSINDLPDRIRLGSNIEKPRSSGTLSKAIKEIEEENLRQALKQCDGNISAAAKKLGIGRATIYRKAKKYGIRINN